MGLCHSPQLESQSCPLVNGVRFTLKNAYRTYILKTNDRRRWILNGLQESRLRKACLATWISDRSPAQAELPCGCFLRRRHAILPSTLLRLIVVAFPVQCKSSQHRLTPSLRGFVSAQKSGQKRHLSCTSFWVLHRLSTGMCQPFELKP